MPVEAVDPLRLLEEVEIGDRALGEAWSEGWARWSREMPKASDRAMKVWLDWTGARHLVAGLEAVASFERLMGVCALAVAIPGILLAWLYGGIVTAIGLLGLKWLDPHLKDP